MYPKLQSHGLAGGTNTGSCAAYAYYLEHENRWKKENQKKKDMIPFFDKNGNEVTVNTVIKIIDGNKKGLHVDDAKFFSLVINPSVKEANMLGNSRDEKIKTLQGIVDKMMDRYARGFRKNGIKDHNDLIYFYTIHEYRKDEDGNLRPGIHVHIIVSRKDLSGKYKLSPMTNHRGESTGVIKSGFNRDAFYRDCESIFDADRGYQRPIVESYDYLNTMKHGSEADKVTMIRAAVKEEGIIKDITASLAQLAARLAKEAAAKEAQRQHEIALARMDAEKKKKNEFWNSYNSYYRPTLDELNKQCQAAFSLYRDCKIQGVIVQTGIDEQYQHLKFINSLIHQKYQEIDNTKTYKDLVKGFAYMVACANPIAALIVGLVLLIALDAKRLEDKEEIRALRKRADEIRKGIEALKDEQGKLQFAQQDTLVHYTQVKDEKKALTDKLQELRKELEPKKETINLETLTKELARRKGTPKEPSTSHIFSTFGIYGQMMSAKNKLDLEIELLANNIVIQPVFHVNGGVADLAIIANNEKSLASDTFSTEKLTALLEKWCELTGQTPAHRVAPKPETNETLPTIRPPMATNQAKKSNDETFIKFKI